MTLGLCNTKRNGALSKEALDANFDDLHAPLSPLQAKAEADRCLYCYDAPCITSCPTSIDIPTFIHQIRSGSLIGSAKTILSENIMGGTCSRACPTEILCEQACVLNVSQHQPVEIGSLQRFAVDHLIEQDIAHPFQRASLSGQHIAVIGAGPGGLACAHRSAMLGHDVTIFEAKNKAGGLNEYGLAAYKMANDFAQKEIEFLLDIGGIHIKYGQKVQYGQKLGDKLTLDSLLEDFDAVFTAVGLSHVNQLEIDDKSDARVIDAIQFIEKIRQTEDKSSITVGNEVIVIGAGNTAIDAAIQSKRLGAENVTIVYRRGEESMSATPWEVDLARQNGVNFRFYSAPKSFIDHTSMASLEFARMQSKDNQLISSEESYQLPTDMVLIAIGQKLAQSTFLDLEIKKGKIVVSDDYQTSIKGLFAGGDCIASGEDLTVQAVEDGKQAAHAINDYLSKSSECLSVGGES
ncbi:MAG: dihydropyrimidine dehydrogenase (NAD+) subunit PreT [Polaribacter sp.]|jgi:dihydropyrimidine dehydrogenase (NAD+) subunit PreT